MRSRTFLHVSLGTLALALAYHFGALSAVAQAPGNPVVAVNDCYIFTSNGDIYWRTTCNGAPPATTGVLVGNVFTGGGPTPVEQSSFGSLKARYRGEVEPQGVRPSTNR